MKPNNPATTLDQAYDVFIRNFRNQTEEQHKAGLALTQNATYFSGSGLPIEDLDKLLVIDETRSGSMNATNLNLLIDRVDPRRVMSPELARGISANRGWISADRYIKRGYDNPLQTMCSPVFTLESSGHYTSDVRGNGLCFVNAAIVSIFYSIKTKEELQKFANDIEAEFLRGGEENPSLRLSVDKIRDAASNNKTNPQFTGQETFNLINEVGVTLADGLCKKIVEDHSKTFAETFVGLAIDAYGVKKDTVDSIIKSLNEANLNEEGHFSVSNESTRAQMLKKCGLEIDSIDLDSRDTFFDTLKTLETLITAVNRGTNPDTLPNDVTTIINQNVFNKIGYDALSCERSSVDLSNTSNGLTPLRLLTRGGHYFPVIAKENIEGRLSPQEVVQEHQSDSHSSSMAAAGGGRLVDSRDTLEEIESNFKKAGEETREINLGIMLSLSPKERDSVFALSVNLEGVFSIEISELIDECNKIEKPKTSSQPEGVKEKVGAAEIPVKGSIKGSQDFDADRTYEGIAKTLEDEKYSDYAKTLSQATLDSLTKDQRAEVFFSSKKFELESREESAARKHSRNSDTISGQIGLYESSSSQNQAEGVMGEEKETSSDLSSPTISPTITSADRVASLPKVGCCTIS